MHKLKLYLKNKVFLGTLLYFALLIVACASLNIKTLVISDGLVQYTAFAHNSISNIISGHWEKLIYDSTLGLGQPFINVFVYYGLSPFNLLLILPFMTMTEVIVIKLGVLAFTTNYVFAKKFKPLSLTEHCFITLVFLTSASVMSNVVSFIWLDSIIGMVALLYVLSEPVAHKNLKVVLLTVFMIWSNFYLSVILLLFIGLLTLLKRQFKPAIAMVFAGLLSLLPIIFGSYQNLITRDVSANKALDIIKGSSNILSLYIKTLLTPASGFESISKYMYTGPHIGTYSLLFVFLIWGLVKSYKRKETWIIGLMAISVFSPRLNAMFHGGQTPSGWNYRFSPLMFILMLFIFIDLVCENRKTNETSFLQLTTLVSKKHLWKMTGIYLGALSILLVIAQIWSPSTIKSVSEFTYPFAIIVAVSLILNTTVFSLRKIDWLKILAFGSIITSVFINFTILYEMRSEGIYPERINTVRHSVGIWERNQSNKTLLNNIIQIDGSTPTLIQPSIAQNSAFVTPISPYISKGAPIYLVSSNRVSYNFSELSPISDLIYGENFTFSMDTNRWSSENNLDRGFILEKYTDPTSTTEFVKMLSNDPISRVKSNVVTLKSENNYTILTVSKKIPSNTRYTIQFKPQNNSVSYYDLNKSSTSSLTVNTRLATKPGDKLKIKMSKDKFLKNIVAIYKTSGHLTPKPELKDTFEITSGQTKTQVLKGTARKSGDLVLRVLYDKNLSVKVNGISVKPERAFSAFIRVPNVNKNDVIQVSYTNPIIKPMLIYTVIVILLSGIGSVIYYKISLERRRK